MIYSKKISKNKAIDVQADYWENWWNYIAVDITLTRRKHADHAGLNITIEICGGMFNFNLYDTRHAEVTNE